MCLWAKWPLAFMKESYSIMYSVELEIVKTSPSHFRTGSLPDLFVGFVMIFIWSNPQIFEAIRMIRHWPYQILVYLPNFIAIIRVGFLISMTNSLILKACVIFCVIFQCSIHACGLILWMYIILERPQAVLYCYITENKLVLILTFSWQDWNRDTEPWSF